MTLSGTTTPIQSGRNDNKGVTLHSQNWNLITGWSLVSYPRKAIFVVRVPLFRGYSCYIQSSTDSAVFAFRTNKSCLISFLSKNPSHPASCGENFICWTY